jgi:hypothetical protein
MWLLEEGEGSSRSVLGGPGSKRSSAAPQSIRRNRRSVRLLLHALRAHPTYPDPAHYGAVASVISVCGPIGRFRDEAEACSSQPARSHLFAQREDRPPSLRNSLSASVGAMAAARS